MIRARAACAARSSARSTRTSTVPQRPSSFQAHSVPRLGRPTSSNIKPPTAPQRLLSFQSRPAPSLALNARPVQSTPRPTHANASSPRTSQVSPPTRSISLDRGEPGKTGRSRPYVDSVGRILDHYVPPHKLSGWLSGKKIWSYLRSWTTWFWTRRRLIVQFGRLKWYAFKRELGPRYVKFHEALAAGDQHALRTMMTEPGFKALKSTISLDRQRNRKYVWRIEQLKKPRIVSYGLLGGHLPTGWTEYAQILVLMKSRQSFAVYDSDNKLISGDETFRPVTEYMIFEALVKKDAPWKITTKVAIDGKPVYDLETGEDNPGSQSI